MLQQTQVRTVIPYFDRWMAALPDVQSLADAPTHQLLKLWEGLGYYSRVRNAHKAAQVIVNEHGAVFPKTYDEILALPGIGRYTAGAICSIAYNLPTPILDGNVVRVLARLFRVKGDPGERNTNSHLWEIAGRLVRLAPGFNTSSLRPCSDLNEGLMELGALVCTPTAPKCDQCPVADYCQARRCGKIHLFPQPKARPAVIEQRHSALIAEHRGKFLVRQRPADVLNAGLWEFPCGLVPNGCDPAKTASQFLLLPNPRPDPFHRIVHGITHHRITLHIFSVRLPRRSAVLPSAGVWRTLSELSDLPFTGSHRKIVAKLALERSHLVPK